NEMGFLIVEIALPTKRFSRGDNSKERRRDGTAKKPGENPKPLAITRKEPRGIAEMQRDGESGMARHRLKFASVHFAGRTRVRFKLRQHGLALIGRGKVVVEMKRHAGEFRCNAHVIGNN